MYMASGGGPRGILGALDGAAGGRDPCVHGVDLVDIDDQHHLEFGVQVDPPALPIAVKLGRVHPRPVRPNLRNRSIIVPA